VSKSKDVTTSTTQQSNIPDWLTNAAKGVASSVTGQPQYQPYTGELAPGMSGNQSLANTLMPGLLGQGAGIIAQGIGGASNAANYVAPKIGVNDVNALTTGLLSPYTQNVVDTTNNEIQRQGTITQQGNDARAAAAGALNGDRAGVMAAENQRNTDMIKANTDAALYGQGFTQAQNAALGIGQANQNASIYGASVNATGANALGNLGNLTQNANISDISGLLGTGGVAQTTQAGQDTANYAAHNNNFLLPAQLQQLFAGSLGTLPHDTSMNGTSTTPVTSNWGAGLAGLGLGIAGLAMPGGGSLAGGLVKGLMS
jgi:hypothetical protein